ncbi:efflux RND transporter periplasmic adaptor subunit [uncultured Pseudoteredinibacter sp.]|uniref:efflux RND transporter periplasmic adaptor subunit n=1 Tax=uncultured Pseudoteredinibacter sp. TaxID=1641701 RepID=UPI00262EF4A6|nr:efflux RND transporter periplasmic adaptor subunit [uncultured Pseudoteredinibacter sp.]
MKQLKTYLYSGLAFSAVFFSAASQAQAPATAVETAQVSLSQNDNLARLPGTVISLRDALLSAEISGRLEWLAEVGDTVEKGDTIAKIDDHLLTLQLRNDQAQIKRIKADLSYQRRQQERLSKLLQNNSVAKNELDQVESRIGILQQDLAIAEINSERAQYQLDRSKVVAPFSGVIANREMNLGELTQIGSPLLRLVDTEQLEISVNAPLRVARFNQPGTMVAVYRDQQEISTEIRGAVPVGDERSRMMELRLKLQGSEWLIGEAVTVELAQAASRQQLSVPRDALVLRKQAVYVFRVNGEDKAERIEVEPGAGQGNQISVTGALSAGDKVIVRGAENLKDGQALKIITAAL